MKRQHFPASDVAAASMFDPAAKPKSTKVERDDPRFDAVSFRQVSGLVRAAPDEELRIEPMQIKTQKPRFDGYSVLWIGLGLISASYLAAMTWQRTGGIEMALAPVTETLERLAGDIAELRQTTAAINVREQVTANRLAATESRLDGFAQTAANLPQSAQSQRPTNRAVLAEAPGSGGGVATAPPPPMPGVRMAGVEVVPAKAPQAAPHGEPIKPARQIAVVTVPVATTAAAPVTKNGANAATRPAAAVTVVQPQASLEGQGVIPNSIQTGSLPARPAGLLVASGPSLDSIKLSWTVLNQNHAAVFGSLEPRIVPAADGSAFQLVAGPFASDAEAQKACATLKARGVGCRPAEYTGAPL